MTFTRGGQVGPALAAGNTIVVKPSELAPCAVIELARCIAEAGAPPGTMNVVPGYGAVTGRALTEHAGIAKLDLTGGTVTGRLVAAAAGRNLIPCCMELGGNAPVLVFSDCEYDQALAGACVCAVSELRVDIRGVGVAFGAFVATGQTCISGKRILIQSSIFDKFVKVWRGRRRKRCAVRCIVGVLR